MCLPAIILILAIITVLIVCSFKKPDPLKMVLPPVNAVETNAYGYVHDDFTTFPYRAKVAHGDNFSKSYL